MSIQCPKCDKQFDDVNDGDFIDCSYCGTKWIVEVQLVEVKK